MSSLPRLRSRPKFASDQTFQTKIISDQTFQTEIISDQTFQTQCVLIRLSRPKEFWSDHLQTMVQTQIQTIAQTLIGLCSDSSALEEVIIRPSCAWSIYDQTQLRLKPFMIRLKRARNQFWSDTIALKCAFDQTQLRSNSLWSDSSALEYAYDQTFQTKMTSDQTISRPWSDCSALELPKRPCNFGLGTHGSALDWVWSEVNLGLDLNLGWVQFLGINTAITI